MQVRYFLSVVAILALSSTAPGVRAQTAPAPTSTQPDQQVRQDGSGTVVQTPPIEEKPDPLKRRLTDGQEKKRRDLTKQELKGEYKTWLNEDVRWIITDEEAK